MSPARGQEPSRADTHAAQALLDGLSEATVLAAMSPQLPEALLSALLRAARSRDVRLTLITADLSGQWAFLDDEALADAASNRLHLVALAGNVARHLARLVDHLPVSLWDADRLIANGALSVDVFVARVRASADPKLVSYGDMIGYSASALEVARRVGFEVAGQLHAHDGTGGIPLERADVITPAEHRAPARSAARVPTAEQRAVAGRVAGLVPDGATLQLGVGAVPVATVEHLGTKADLGLHSGVLPGQVQELIANGVATGARKTHQRGQHVATGTFGGDSNAWGGDVRLGPISQTHHPARLLEHENLWAINSAFEIDLAGQANAEFADGAHVASGAGQIDFARAAHASPRGASVLALPARARTGASRIVPRTGHPITTPASDIDYVVTEYGVARLHELTAEERSHALIEIAHPDDRPQLRAAVAAEAG